MFSHVYLIHIFANMFSLWFLGKFVEKLIGRKRFIWFYLIAGLFAGGLTLVLSKYFGYGFYTRIFGDPSASMLGASGAIFGLVGLLAVLIPYSQIYLILGPLIAIILEVVLGTFTTSNALLTVITVLINVYVLVAIFSLLSFNPRYRKISLPVQMPLWLLPICAIIPLFLIGLFIPLPIGNIAHFGGLFIGLIYGYYLKQKYPKKVVMLRGMFR
jgi:membrane associated rhomboid family serine protease